MFALHTGNEVGDEGATKVAEALCSNSSLQTLWLGGMQTLAISTPYTAHPASYSLHPELQAHDLDPSPETLHSESRARIQGTDPKPHPINF